MTELLYLCLFGFGVLNGMLARFALDRWRDR